MCNQLVPGSNPGRGAHENSKKTITEDSLFCFAFLSEKENKAAICKVLADCFDDGNQDDGAEDGHEEAIDIKASDSTFAKKAHHPTADNCADNPQNNIQHQTIARAHEN